MDNEKKSLAKPDQDEHPKVVDEEFAEKMYSEHAPVPAQFDEDHEVSATGGELRDGTPSGVDAPPSSSDDEAA